MVPSWNEMTNAEVAEIIVDAFSKDHWLQSNENKNSIQVGDLIHALSIARRQCRENTIGAVRAWAAREMEYRRLGL